MHKKNYIITSGVVFLTTMLIVGSAHATRNIHNTWLAVYANGINVDNSLTDGSGAICQVCHVSSNGGNPWNAYGWDIRTQVQAGLSATDAINSVDVGDSDGDGNNNGAEINFVDDGGYGAQPGWTDNGAGNVSCEKATGNCTATSAPATAGSLDPNVVSEPDTDNDGLPDNVEDSNGNGSIDPGETDPMNPDTDNDGLTDGYEVTIGGTDPTVPNNVITGPLADINGDGVVNLGDLLLLNRQLFGL